MNKRGRCQSNSISSNPIKTTLNNNFSSIFEGLGMKSCQFSSSFFSIHLHNTNVRDQLITCLNGIFIYHSFSILFSMESNSGCLWVWMSFISYMKFSSTNENMLCSQVSICFISESENTIDSNKLKNRSFWNIKNHVPS